MGDKEVSVRTFLVVPRELTIQDSLFAAQIPPKGVEKIDIAVENFSALSGSTYQIFAVSEFVNEGIHQTSITPGIINIVEEKTLLGLNYTYLLVILVVLLVVFVIFQIAKSRK